LRTGTTTDTAGSLVFIVWVLPAALEAARRGNFGRFLLSP
jgi:hypothetical protein